MPQENYIAPSELIKAIAQELLKSALKIKSAELELKVAVKQAEDGSFKVSVLEAIQEVDLNHCHTLKLVISETEPPVILDGTDDQHGGGPPPPPAKTGILKTPRADGPDGPH